MQLCKSTHVQYTHTRIHRHSTMVDTPSLISSLNHDYEKVQAYCPRLESHSWWHDCRLNELDTYWTFTLISCPQVHKVSVVLIFCLRKVTEMSLALKSAASAHLTRALSLNARCRTLRTTFGRPRWISRWEMNLKVRDRLSTKMNLKVRDRLP